MKIISGLLFASLVMTEYGKAGTLPEGMALFRFDSSVTSSKSLWMGNAPTDYENNGETRLVSSGISLLMGFKNLQVDTRITYAEFSMLSGKMADAKGGDVNAGLQEVAFKLSQTLFESDFYGLDGFFAVRAPGSNKSPDTFLALNNGNTNYEFGFINEFKMDSSVFSNTIKYNDRPDPIQGDQFYFDLGYRLQFKKSSFGFLFSQLKTNGGVDIGSAQFESLMTAKGGKPPFSSVKEEYQAIGITGDFWLTRSTALDWILSKKISGRNTDIGSSFGFGINWIL